MAHNEIEDVLDQLRRTKSGGDLNADKIDQIETLEIELRFLRTFIKYHHLLLPDSFVKIRKKLQLLGKMLESFFCGNTNECKANLNVKRLVSQLPKLIEGNTSSIYMFELSGSYLSEYMDILDKNLNDVPRYLVRSNPFFVKEIKTLQKTDQFLKQVKFIQKKMIFLRYLYATEIKSYIDREKLEGLEPRIQFMANNVGQFCLAIWTEDEDYSDKDKDEHDTDSHEDEDDRSSHEDEDGTDSHEDGKDINSHEDQYYTDAGENRVDIALYQKKNGDAMVDIKNSPSYLLSLIELVQLKMQKIFLGELKASKFSRTRTFKNKKLPKDFPHHLRTVLLFIRNKNLENYPNNASARKIDVAIEFLLVFVADVPSCFINGKKLNTILEKVGALVGDILCVTQNSLSSSIIKDQTSEINLVPIHILEETENLKAQVKEWYDKLSRFTPSQFPTVGGLSILDSFLRKLNEMLKSESGLDSMMKPHIATLEKELSSLTYVLRDVTMVHHELEILKDLQKRAINLVCGAGVAIDSILVQHNALWHLFSSLPMITKEIKHISAEVTKMWSKNLALKPCPKVEPSKHLPIKHSNPMNNEDIVGFENDTKNIIQLLIGGKYELDVIPIIGMGGQGKTTCARKLYCDEIVVSHFDVLAWCVISQTYNRRELLQEILSQVTGSKDMVEEDNVLADMLRKRLMGKRYLIVLDDL